MIKEIGKRCLAKWGEDIQLTIAQEELAELIQAISKFKRFADKDALASEIVDVQIMLEQLKLILNDDHKLNNWLQFKYHRLSDILDSCEYEELPKKRG